MAESPPSPGVQSNLTPMHLDPNLQVISPQLSNSSIATPLRIVSPANWVQSPSPISGHPLQLAIIPPSVNPPVWNLPYSSTHMQQTQISNSPTNTMCVTSSQPLDSSTQNNPSVDPPKKKRKYTRRKTSCKSNNQTPASRDSNDGKKNDEKKNVSWKGDLNADGKSAIVLIIEWLGTATTTGTRYDWWKGEMDVDTRSIYSKKDVGEKIAEYLAENGLPGRDGKGVETQIRTLESTFTVAQDFRTSTGQGILEEFEKQAQEEKIENGYISDSDEWRSIEHSTKSKFDQLLFQRCSFYYDLLPFMSTRTNVIPQAIRESGEVLDEEDVLPSTKRARNVSPISIGSSRHIGQDLEPSNTPWESPLDPEDDFTQDIDSTLNFLTDSQNRRASPTPNDESERGSARRPPGRPSRRPKGLTLDHDLPKSSCSSASDVHNLLSSQLPSRDERAERNKLEKDRMIFEENYMQAEQDARKEELKTQAKLADAVSRHLAGGDDHLDENGRAERSQLKLEQDRVQLKLTQAQLARSREDLITARSERKLAMLAKYKALGFSIEEAKKEVEEVENQIRRDLEEESQG